MKPRIYIITDTHFNHDKMVEYCGRPENHTQLVGENLLELGFTELDTLIHLGDICIGGDQRAHDLYIKPLKCKKWLLRGNHDHKSNNWYLTNGWDWVGDYFQGYYFGKSILFSHIPQKDTGFDINIHGHFHNTLHRLLKKEWVTPDEEARNMVPLSVLTDKHKLLVLENTDYKPTLLESFI